MSETFELPPIILNLVNARNALRKKFINYGLKFTLDGNLIGDIGEVLAAELFNLDLVETNTAAIDAVTQAGKTVQIKTTGTNRGPAFRKLTAHADFLLFLSLDLENLEGRIIYNGPEALVKAHLPNEWINQKQITMSKMMRLSLQVEPNQKLPRVT